MGAARVGMGGVGVLVAVVAVVWLTWVAGHFTTERATEAKMQCSRKVIATHWVPCDIFITERGEKKQQNALALARSLTLCMCTTFRPAAVIPGGETACGIGAGMAEQRGEQQWGWKRLGGGKAGNCTERETGGNEAPRETGGKKRSKRLN